MKPVHLWRDDVGLHIRLVCSDAYLSPSWPSEKVRRERASTHIFETSNGLSYTFDTDKVTCDTCNKKREDV